MGIFDTTATFSIAFTRPPVVGPTLGYYIEGTAADDVLYGSQAADMMVGLDGHDTLYGGLGNETLDDWSSVRVSPAESLAARSAAPPGARTSVRRTAPQLRQRHRTRAPRTQERRWGLFHVRLEEAGNTR